ncbi:MAG TPA: TRIC cation channel family protein [Gemmatimonadaceae bacterium]
MNSQLVLQVVEAAAVVVSAIAGMIIASNKRMDLVGTFALACVNAFGGGTMRDLLLDNRPFYWMANWGFFLAILAIAIPFVYSVRVFELASEVHRRSVKTDALGLALFTISGAGIALAHDAPLVVAVLMGVIAGTTGGVLRDIVVNEVPDLFRPGGLYASASLAGALVFVGCVHEKLDYTSSAVAGAAIVVLLRLLSVRLGVAMPKPQWLNDRERRA